TTELRARTMLKPAELFYQRPAWQFQSSFGGQLRVVAAMHAVGAGQLCAGAETLIGSMQAD
ncbi:MAG: hypothetical protein ACE5K7_02950, partial [Phycisphaerae bacterium]